MRHGVGGRKLGRTTSHRTAMLRNMVTSFLQHERIETTDAKAKELRRVAERMITLAKKGSLHARRQAAAVIRDKDVLKKLFDEIGTRFADRQGGYTRIVKTGFRTGDSAPLAVIELMAKPEEKKGKKEKPGKKESKPKAAPKAKKEPKAAKEPKAGKEAKEKKPAAKKAPAKKAEPKEE
ncbi:MAG: 50S ribosomal protein L17 [Syntrophaceae bacterium]|nr:50S ribosomal protein L17 [Syntrophaceae bacterium]